MDTLLAGFFLVAIASFVAGFAVAKRQADNYWIRRIRQGHVPSHKNAKFWNP